MDKHLYKIVLKSDNVERSDDESFITPIGNVRIDVAKCKASSELYSDVRQEEFIMPGGYYKYRGTVEKSLYTQAEGYKDVYVTTSLQDCMYIIGDLVDDASSANEVSKIRFCGSLSKNECDYIEKNVKAVEYERYMEYTTDAKSGVSTLSKDNLFSDIVGEMSGKAKLDMIKSKMDEKEESELKFETTVAD